MRNLPIIWRLSLQFCAITTVILLLSGGSIWFLYTRNLQRSIDTLLFVQSENIRNRMGGTDGEKEAVDFQDETFARINEVGHLGLAVSVLRGTGTVIEQSSAAVPLFSVQNGYSDVQRAEASYRVYATTVGSYRIIVSQNLEDYESAIDSLQFILALVFGVAILFSAVISAFFAGRAIAPLRTLRREVQGVDPSDLAITQLQSSYPNDEIGHLAKEFDRLLLRLREAMERERQFTQDASHELRTPLMIMKSSLELLLLHPKRLTPEQVQKCTLMHDAIERMQRLTEELLFLSRGESHSEEEEISMKEFLRRFVAPYETMARGKDIELRLQMKENFTVRTSTVALENVIGNLLKNAIRFTEKGVITVVISKPILSVSDTGAGIAENQLQHIFQRFYRGDASRRHGEGFGLGLSICQNICKREGWNIAVKSVKRGGSTFTVDFSTAILTKK